MSSFQDGQTDVDNIPAVQPVSGTVTAKIEDTNGNPLNSNGAGALKTDGSAVTQPISATTLPLPVNAAQETGGHLASLDSKLTNPLPVSTASLPLPTGAATSANQTNGTQQTQIVQGGNIAVVDATGDQQVDVNNFPAVQSVSGTVTTLPPAHASTNVDQIGGAAISEGQKTSANSVPVVIASDQSAIPVSGSITTSPNVNVHDSSGNPIGSSGTSLNVDVTNTVPVTLTSTTITGNVTVVQPTGSNLNVSISSEPNQPLSGNTVFVQNFLDTTTVTADQVVMSYTIPVGRVFYLSYAEVEAFDVTFATAITNFGVAHFSLNGGHMNATRLAGAGSSKTDISLSNALPFPSGSILSWLVTPASVTPTEWYGNISGYLV